MNTIKSLIEFCTINIITYIMLTVFYVYKIITAEYPRQLALSRGTDIFLLISSLALVTVYHVAVKMIKKLQKDNQKLEDERHILRMQLIDNDIDPDYGDCL